MVGSKEEALCTKAKAHLQHMGKNIAYCGPVGNLLLLRSWPDCQGWLFIIKVCNNMMLGISMIAASETLNLAERLVSPLLTQGMDPKLMSNILNTSTGRCWSTDSYNPVPGVMENVPSSRDYEGGFAAHLTHKDMGLAIEAASASKSTGNWI
jgi:3-hydroxyisobutyrate dehydrogenase